MSELSLDLTDADSYKSYFEAICTSNKLLGEDQFLFGDREVGQGEAAEWSGKKLWAWPAGRAKMTDFDNFFLKREGSIWIGGAAPEKFSDQDSFYGECEVIAKQVLSKMIYDKSIDKISTDFTAFVLDRADMMFGGTKFIGVEIQINFNDPDGLEYDENDWI